MGESGIDRWRRYVPGAGSDEDLEALRTLLAGYAEVPSGEPLDVFVPLFYESLYADETALPADILALLDRLGLIARDPECPGLIYGTAAILRVEGELIVCDRGGAPDGSTYRLPADVVYPPIFENTRRFLAGLPTTPCDAMLEIGTGAGIAAILGARCARHVWATDIAARAVDFTRLSCRLAGLENVTVVAGDLYHPVDGLTFDRIVFQPPWIPAQQSQFIFGDGGEDGEAVLRGAVEGLPRFLRPGGRFYSILLASDREGEPLEQRIRRWLGRGGEQFDLAMAELSRDTPHGFLAQNVARGSIGKDEVAAWTEIFEATRTEAMVYAQLILERHEGEREPITERVRRNGIQG